MLSAPGLGGARCARTGGRAVRCWWCWTAMPRRPIVRVINRPSRWSKRWKSRSPTCASRRRFGKKRPGAKTTLLAAALEGAALERTPALEEEPSEPREERVIDSEEEPHSTHAPPMPETPVSEAQHKRKVPWWRAFFGFE